MADNIHMVSTSVGSGKTTVAIDWMLQFEEQENWIYVAPTIKLIEETESRINEKLLEQIKQSGSCLGLVESLHAKQGPNVTQRVIRKLSEDVQYNIILITTETFMNVLSLIPDKSKFGVILDEAFKPYDTEQYQSNKNLHLLTGLFDEQLNPIDKGLVNKIAQKRFEGINEYYIEKVINICNFIVNPALEVAIITQTDNLFEVGYYVKPEQFEGFGEVILMAANFELSILYHIWQKLGVNLQQHHFFTDNKLTNIHKTKGHLVDIFHMLHRDDNSSLNNLKRNFLTAQENEPDRNMTVASYLLDEVNQFFGGIEKEYLLTINSVFEDMGVNIGSATPIPVRAHGLNKFDRCDNCVTLAITNANPQTEVPYLKEITGMSDEEIHSALRIDAFYQALGRTSVRNRDNNDRKIFIVPSEADAIYLHNLFEGSMMHGQLGNIGSLEHTKAIVKKPLLKDEPGIADINRELKSAQRQKNRLDGRGLDTTEIEKVITELKARKEGLKSKNEQATEVKKEKLLEGMMPRGLNANNYPVRNERIESVRKNIADYMKYLEG